jgi:translation elongation factor EF-1alpha
MALTPEQVGNLQQGDLVFYTSGSGDTYIEAYAVVDNFEDMEEIEDNESGESLEGLVAITLKNIIIQGDKLDHTHNQSIVANPSELTLQ